VLQDPQAANILNQALTVAGGASVINAIKDYTATGNITYHRGEDVSGTVTMNGLDVDQFRLDANLPNGVFTQSFSDGRIGTKTADGNVSWSSPAAPIPGQTPKPIPSSDSFPYQPPKFPGSLPVPYLQIATVLSTPRYMISYRGIVNIDGHPTHEIEAQEVFKGRGDPMSEYNTSDYFIDVSTLRLIMIEDLVPKNVVHQIRYSDYRSVSGVLIPFSIIEEMGGQATWEIQLTKIGFNAGLQDSVFAL